jgi:hypothetical protein
MRRETRCPHHGAEEGQLHRLLGVGDLWIVSPEEGPAGEGEGEKEFIEENLTQARAKPSPRGFPGPPGQPEAQGEGEPSGGQGAPGGGWQQPQVATPPPEEAHQQQPQRPRESQPAVRQGTEDKERERPGREGDQGEQEPPEERGEHSTRRIGPRPHSTPSGRLRGDVFRISVDLHPHLPGQIAGPRIHHGGNEDAPGDRQAGAAGVELGFPLEGCHIAPAN